MTDKNCRPEQASELRCRAEKIAQSSEDPEAPWPEETRKILHELRVHQIELEMQNEELRRSQAELDASRARYFDLYDLAPVGYCTLSENGLILEANMAAATLLNVDRGSMVKRLFTSFILPEDQDSYYLHRNQLLEAGQPTAIELRMKRRGGPSCWVHLMTTAVRGTDGTPECRVVMSDISRIKEAEERIKSSLAEKEVLLMEVHHRVKNNLAAIMGLVDLQGQKMNDATARAALTELSGRIRSMALVHEQVYKSDNFSRINFQDYIMVLIADLSLYYERAANFRVSVAAKGVVMSLDNAVPCGLLITELVTNVFKYAFPEGRPRPGAEICEIGVSAEWDGAAYTLTVADNGVGLPVDLDWTNTNTMGLLLVKMLGQHQLQGRIELDRSCGTTFRLRFKPKDK